MLTIDAGHLTGYNRHLDGLVGHGQGKTFRCLFFPDIVVPGGQIDNLNKAIAGGACLRSNIHRIGYGVLAGFVPVQLEFCTVQGLIGIAHFIQPDAAGLGIVERQAVFTHRAGVAGRYRLFLHGIGEQVVIFVILGQAGNLPRPHVGIGFLVPFDGGLLPGRNAGAVAVHHQRHIFGTFSIRIAAILPYLGTGKGHREPVHQGEFQIGIALFRIAFGRDVHQHIFIGFRFLHHIFSLVALGVIGGQIDEFKFVAVPAAAGGLHLRAVLIHHRHQFVVHLLEEQESNIIRPVRVVLHSIFPNLFTGDLGLFDTVGNGHRHIAVFIHFINIGIVIIRLATQVFLDGVDDLLTIFIKALQIFEGELPFRLLAYRHAAVGIGIFAFVQVHPDFLGTAVFKPFVVPHLGTGDVDGLIVANARGFRCTGNFVAGHHVHHFIRQHMNCVHRGGFRQQIAFRRLGFLHIIVTGNQAVLAFDHIPGVGIAAPLGDHHAHHFGAVAITVNGEFRTFQIGVGLAVHLFQGHVTADHGVGKGDAFRITVAVNGDQLIPVIRRQRDRNIIFGTYTITVGRSNFPDIIGNILIAQRYLIQNGHAVAIGGGRGNQRI